MAAQLIEVALSDCRRGGSYAIRLVEDALICDCAWFSRAQFRRAPRDRVCKHVNRCAAALAHDQSEAARRLRPLVALQLDRASEAVAIDPLGEADLRNALEAVEAWKLLSDQSTGSTTAD